jgi:hypothetical protein
MTVKHVLSELPLVLRFSTDQKVLVRLGSGVEIQMERPQLSSPSLLLPLIAEPDPHESC